MTKVEEFQRCVQQALNLDFSFFTQVYKFLYNEPCPKCSVYIEKNGGCRHMTCTRCVHEFCWYCLAPYVKGKHSGSFFCPFRYIATVYLFILLCALLNLKLAYSFEIVFRVEMFFLNNIVSLILIDLYGLSYAYHIAIYIQLKDYYYNTMSSHTWK